MNKKEAKKTLSIWGVAFGSAGGFAGGLMRTWLLIKTRPMTRRADARIRKLGAALLVLGLGISLSGCVVYPVRPGGGCYWHPYRCG